MARFCVLHNHIHLGFRCKELNNVEVICKKITAARKYATNNRTPLLLCTLKYFPVEIVDYLNIFMETLQKDGLIEMLKYIWAQ